MKLEWEEKNIPEKSELSLTKTQFDLNAVEMEKQRKIAKRNLEKKHSDWMFDKNN